MSKNQEIDMEDMQRFLPYDPNAVTFTDKKQIEEKKQLEAFNGLTKEQIMAYANDPKWVKTRWILFGLFWFVWIVMLVAAVLVVVYTPKCAFRPKQPFWEKEVVYQLDVEKFKDSNQDGHGDLQGIVNTIDYFDQIGIKTLLLKSNILNDEQNIKAEFGTMDDLKTLRTKLNEKDMHLIFDINSESYSHEKNQATIGSLLKEYLDGIRLIIVNKDDPNLNQTLDKTVEQSKKIAKETFKPKFLAFSGPFENNYAQTKFMDRTFIDAEKKDSSGADFANKLKKIYGKDDSSPLFAIAEFSSERKKLDNSDNLQIFHSLVLLLKGTPFVLYGDEIESDDLYMRWDNSNNCGFSENNVSLIVQNCEHNVKKYLARGETLPRIYEKLNSLRQEPSFSWGSIKFADQDNHLISFVRKADGFDGYLVIANTGDKEETMDFKKIFGLSHQEATVEYFLSKNDQFKNDFKKNDTIQLNNIYLKKGELLVLKYSK